MGGKFGYAYMGDVGFLERAVRVGLGEATVYNAVLFFLELLGPRASIAAWLTLRL